MSVVGEWRLWVLQALGLDSLKQLVAYSFPLHWQALYNSEFQIKIAAANDIGLLSETREHGLRHAVRAVCKYPSTVSVTYNIVLSDWLIRHERDILELTPSEQRLQIISR
jgi:hypothetical protein